MKPLHWSALLGALLAVSACTLKPSIQVSNTPNQVGGTLHVSGQNYTQNGLVDISATNTPGHPAIRLIDKSKADGSGSFTADIPFAWPAPQSLPGCTWNSNDKVTLTITGTDETSHSPAFATIDLPNCGMVWNSKGM